VCGCSGFLRDTTGAGDVKNAIIADYTNLDYRQASLDPPTAGFNQNPALLGHGYAEIEDILQIGRSVRDRIEASESEKVAMQICSRLPKNEAEVESMIQTGYELAKNMNWDVVVKNYLLSSLQLVPAKAEA
jgi:hypothetical protein